MKINCSHPDCSNQSPELPWYNWLYLRMFPLYVCPEHRFDWEDLEKVYRKSDRMEITEDGDLISLRDLAPGSLFRFNNTIALKTEYVTGSLRLKLIL